MVCRRRRIPIDPPQRLRKDGNAPAVGDGSDRRRKAWQNCKGSRDSFGCCESRKSRERSLARGRRQHRARDDKEFFCELWVSALGVLAASFRLTPDVRVPGGGAPVCAWDGARFRARFDRVSSNCGDRGGYRIWRSVVLRRYLSKDRTDVCLDDHTIDLCHAPARRDRLARDILSAGGIEAGRRVNGQFKQTTHRRNAERRDADERSSAISTRSARLEGESTATKTSRR